MKRRILALPALAALCALVLLSFSSPLPAHGQSEIHFTGLEASHVFGDSFTFIGFINPDLETTSIELTFRPTATGKSLVVPATRDDINLSAEYIIKPQDYIPPFGMVEYWFSAALDDGSQIQSEVVTFQYDDTRFTWQSLIQDDYNVHWVEGDRAFGQEILDAVLETNTSYTPYLDLPVPETLNVYVYPSYSALQSALEITNAAWVAGHTDPAANTILVSIPPGFDQQLSIQRQIPHEVTHVRLYQYMQENYLNLPIWLSEGLASLAEQYTLPEYWQILQAAYQDETLIPLSDLCSTFPTESDRASLAYAEADSITRYIYQTYGKFGLHSLVDAYIVGHSCETGVSMALNIPLNQLEADWQKATFNNAILSISQASAFSWVLIFGLMIGVYIVVTILPKRRR